MKKNGKISIDYAAAIKFASICMMISCLIFLTSMNYFLYPSDQSASFSSVMETGNEDTNNDYPSSNAPTEEKSTSAGFSILEEFLHENHMAMNFAIMNKLFLHKVAEAENIEMVHTELISPPPKL